MPEEISPENSGNTGITVTRRNLPHWSKAGAIYWVTFRLADSLPQEMLSQWKSERDIWIVNHPPPWTDPEWQEYNELFGQRLENWLDAGYGSGRLARPKIREALQECLLHFHGQRFRLHRGVIMPNHTHLLLEPFAGYRLSDLLRGIKGVGARRINQLTGATGRVWMEESYDHIVRSPKQYRHYLRYIAENPIKAGLHEDSFWLFP